jgi:hypothetical protein
MSLEPESFLRICRGTRRLGGGRPVLVITGDTMDAKAPFAEFYIFHEFPDMPFLYSRTSCSHIDDMYLFDFGRYPEIFSARALLDSQFRAAQDRLELEVSLRDTTVSSAVFHAGTSMKYEEVGDLPLVEFTIFRTFARERDSMFKFSKSKAIALLKEKLLGLPEAVINREPKT